MENSKNCHYVNNQKQKPKHFCHCSLILELQRKTQCSQVLDGTILYLHREKKKVSFNSGHWSPMASGSIPKADAGNLHPSCDAMEELPPLPVGDRYNKGLGHLSNNTHTLGRTKQNSLGMKQGKIFPHKVVSLAQAMWALYLLVKCPRSKAYSSHPSGGQTTTYVRLLFPTALLN